MTLDSASAAGPSPMQALGFALAGCMAMDVVHVLKKGRHDLRGLKASLIAARSDAEPRRFTSVAITSSSPALSPRRFNAPSTSPAIRYLFGLEHAAAGHRAHGDLHGRGRLAPGS